MVALNPLQMIAPSPTPSPSPGHLTLKHPEPSVFFPRPTENALYNQETLGPPTTQDHIVGLQRASPLHLGIHFVLVHNLVNIVPSHATSATSCDATSMLPTSNLTVTALDELLEHRSRPHYILVVAPSKPWFPLQHLRSMCCPLLSTSMHHKSCCRPPVSNPLGVYLNSSLFRTYRCSQYLRSNPLQKSSTKSPTPPRRRHSKVVPNGGIVQPSPSRCNTNRAHP